MEKVFIPANSAESEFTEKKSRFISMALPISDPDRIREIIKDVRHSHPRSRHVVWAYILGDSRSVFGLSDDGEPHGTAGKPVLEVLKGSGLTDILLLVIRYFGGIKLGTGGLVSAYTRSAQDVLAKVDQLEKIPKTLFRLSYPYTFHDQFKKVIREDGGEILKELFETDVTLEIELPDDKRELCSRKIRDISSGAVDLSTCE
jgi:uncharacterized YigZ family protein